MIPKMQSRYGSRDGNCFEACLASLLEIPLKIIPDLRQYHIESMWAWAKEDETNAWWETLNDWLCAKGWIMLAIQYPNADEPCLATSIAVGKSPRGDHKHAVLWKQGETVHDPYPHPPKKSLDGNPDYLVYLVPLDPARRLIRFNTDTHHNQNQIYGTNW